MENAGQNEESLASKLKVNLSAQFQENGETFEFGWAAATFLDPRFKTNGFSCQQKCEMLKSICLTKVVGGETVRMNVNRGMKRKSKDCRKVDVEEIEKKSTES